MLKGNIDFIDQNKVSGWVYCSCAPVSGYKVLAFENNECIGSGDVNIFRQDLHDVGFGDGNCGFDFEIHAGKEIDLNNVEIKLEGSDFSIKIGSQKQKHYSRTKKYLAEEFERIEWMSRQGWIDNEQYVALKELNNQGFYVRAFSKIESSKFGIKSAASSIFEKIASHFYRGDVFIQTIVDDNFNEKINEIKCESLVALYMSDMQIDISVDEVHGYKKNVVKNVSSNQMIILHSDMVNNLNLSGSLSIMTCTKK
jgi:hypothetical protein